MECLGTWLLCCAFAASLLEWFSLTGIFSTGFLLLSLNFQFLVTELVALTELCIFG